MRINEDAGIDAEVVVDSDTEGVPGQPPVSDTILGKINSCDIFMPDVSFVAITNTGKSIPNPNVMIEYGYAIKARTVYAMMPIMNTAFGPPEILPFDMGHLRHPITYNIEPGSPDGLRRSVREALSKKIELTLRMQINSTAPVPPPPVPFPATEPKDGQARFRSAEVALGKKWDQLAIFSGPKATVSLASGPAIWLRLMPTNAQSNTWTALELRAQAIKTGSLRLKPFTDYGPTVIRDEDGIGICSIGQGQPTETDSVAFLFETGEIWSIDTYILAANENVIPFLETEFIGRFKDYAALLTQLGVTPPFRWIAGIAGVKGRHLAIPAAPGQPYVVGFAGPECMSDTIVEEGVYDGSQDPSSVLTKFFNKIFAKCAAQRPSHLVK